MQNTAALNPLAGLLLLQVNNLIETQTVSWLFSLRLNNGAQQHGRNFFSQSVKMDLTSGKFQHVLRKNWPLTLTNLFGPTS